MSHAWTAASRAQAAAAVAAGRAPWGSGVGTDGASAAIAAQAARAVAIAGASSSSTVPSRCPDGSKGLSCGPLPVPIAAAQASWSPAACCSTWATVQFVHGVGASSCLPVTAAPAELSRSRASVMTVHMMITFPDRSLVPVAD